MALGAAGNQQLSDIVARFTGREITVAELVDSAQARGLLYGARAEDPEALVRLADEMLTGEVLARAARDRGLDQLPDVRNAINAILIQKIVTSVIDPAAEERAPTEEQLRAYYDEHLDDYSSAESRRPMIIAIGWGKGEERDKAVEEAHWIHDQLADESNKSLAFGKLARAYSDHDSAQRGGDINWVNRRTAPQALPSELAEAVFAVPEKGGLTPVIMGEDSRAYVALVNNIRPGATRTFEQSKGEIRSLLSRNLRTEVYREFLAELNTLYHTEILEDAIRSIELPEPPTVADGGPPSFPVQ